MSHAIRVFCSEWMPSGWEASPCTKISDEGWITGKPRRGKVVRLVRREPVSSRLRAVDADTLLRTTPHLAIALLRR